MPPFSETARPTPRLLSLRSDNRRGVGTAHLLSGRPGAPDHRTASGEGRHGGDAQGERAVVPRADPRRMVDAQLTLRTVLLYGKEPDDRITTAHAASPRRFGLGRQLAERSDLRESCNHKLPTRTLQLTLQQQATKGPGSFGPRTSLRAYPPSFRKLRFPAVSTPRCLIKAGSRNAPYTPWRAWGRELGMGRSPSNRKDRRPGQSGQLTPAATAQDREAPSKQDRRDHRRHDEPDAATRAESETA
jgi:hypothetical protein